MKKYIVTESQLKKIVDRLVVEEQSKKNINEDNSNVQMNKAIQHFLNVKLKLNLIIDGKTGIGSNTEKAIMQYQRLLNIDQDGIWGENTMNKMPEEDKQLFKKIKRKYGIKFFGV